MNSKPLIITMDVVRGFISGFNLIPPLYRYELIEDNAAEMLANSVVQLELDGVRAISVQAIKLLVKRQDDLSLGISEITNEQATALTGIRKKLSLNSLKEISLTNLEILVSNPRESLSLDGLKTLKQDQAELLGRFQGDLSLGGLSGLDEEVAKYLARHAGNLSLENVKALSIEESRQLSMHQGSVLLNKTLHVSREGAYLLRKHFGLQVNAYSLPHFVEDCLTDGTEKAIVMAQNSIKSVSNTLCLDSLKAIQCSGAEILAQFPGQLQLSALKEFEPGAAALLAKHQGTSLALDGLQSLTAPVAEALGKHHGELLLGGLVSFEEDSARLLALHDGPLVLPLPHGGNCKFGWFKNENQKVFWTPFGIDYQSAKVLWAPCGIDYHDLAVVENILQTNPACIEIPQEVHFVSNTVLARLGYACRTRGIDVEMPGMTEIDHQQCRLLTGGHLQHTHPSGAGRLGLDGLLQINEQVAQELGASELNLSLATLSNPSSEVLRHLAQGIKDLTLCGLEAVDEEGWKNLANLRGQLRLDGIKVLSAASATAISSHTGRLTLNGLHSISEEAINELSQHVNPIEMGGIPWTMMNGALLERYIRKTILLDELEVLNLIRGFRHFISWKHLSDATSRNLRSMANDPAIPELICRILMEILICCGIVSYNRSSDQSLRRPSVDELQERKILWRLNCHRQTPPDMAFDELTRHVRKEHLAEEEDQDNDDCALIATNKKESVQQERGRGAYRKLYGIAEPYSNSNFVSIESPGLQPIIESCCQTAKVILSSGLTGESNVSWEMLLVLGFVFGKTLALPEVEQLCSTGALALSMMKADLELNNVKSISPEIALILSQHGYKDCWDLGDDVHYFIGGRIELNGIEHLDVDSAASLALHRGHTLCLNGLTSISDAVAEALSIHKGHNSGYPRILELQGLCNVSPRAAQYLSGCLSQDP